MPNMRTQVLTFPIRGNASSGQLLRIVRVVVWHMRQTICALSRGHEMVRQFEPDRLSLRCLHCGFESPGWTLGVARRDPHAHAGVLPIDTHRRWPVRHSTSPTPAHPSHRAA
jgi:hypothetical protein